MSSSAGPRPTSTSRRPAPSPRGQPDRRWRPRWVHRLVRRLAWRMAAGLAAGGRAGAAPAAGRTVGNPAEPGQQVLVMLRLPPQHLRPNADYGGSYGDAMGRSAL